MAQPMSAGENVFTYGSLMYEAVWTRVVRGQYASVRARLAGFRRLAIRDESLSLIHISEPTRPY